jgi:hypothetical protein
VCRLGGDRAGVSRAAVVALVLAAPTGSGALAAHLTGACRLSGFEPVRREVRLVQTAVALVGAGEGVSVLPAAAREVCPQRQ